MAGLSFLWMDFQGLVHQHVQGLAGPDLKHHESIMTSSCWLMDLSPLAATSCSPRLALGPRVCHRFSAPGFGASKSVRTHHRGHPGLSRCDPVEPGESATARGSRV